MTASAVARRPVGRPQRVSQRAAGQQRRRDAERANNAAHSLRVPLKDESGTGVHPQVESPAVERETAETTTLNTPEPRWAPIHESGSLHGPVYSGGNQHDGSAPRALYERTWESRT
jgi:hypothetical protein